MADLTPIDPLVEDGMVWDKVGVAAVAVFRMVKSL